ncbi:MAG: putative Ig domain-containing protein, partial [Phenylobacterium sp.]|uniref:putative Ig domain-containing protein n=1 Tax=Phenylobacterium sp. TaxID=1871053 RepID=UPI0025E31B19
SATITLTVSDGSASSTTSFTLTVDPVNDRPVASGSATLAAIAEDTAAPPGALVSALFAANYSDATDGTAATPLAGVAIVANAATATQGTWQYSANGSTGWTDVPTSGLSDASALVLPASHWLRFVPSANWDRAPGALTARLADGSGDSLTLAASADLTGALGPTGPWSDRTVAAGAAITAINDAPVLAEAIPDQAANQDTRFSFTVPGPAFTDVDTGDTLAYSATRADGSPLPSWLAFDAATRSFRGMPSQLDVGPLDIRVMVTDSAGATAQGVFRIAITALPPAPPEIVALPTPAATNLPATVIAQPTVPVRPLEVSASAAVSALEPLLPWIPLGAAPLATPVTVAGTGWAWGGSLAAAGTSGLAAPGDRAAGTGAITLGTSTAAAGGTPQLMTMAWSPVRSAASSDPEDAGQTDLDVVPVASASGAARVAIAQDAERSSGADGSGREEGAAAAAAGTGPTPTDTRARIDAPERAAGPATAGNVVRWVSGLAMRGPFAANPPPQPSLSWAPVGEVTVERGAFGSALGLQVAAADNRAAQERIEGSFRHLNDELRDKAAQQQDIIFGSVVVGTGLSIGYMLWLARGGALLASIAAAIPAWASMDPLPVLSRQKQRGVDDRDPEDSGHGADNQDTPGSRRNRVERLFGSPGSGAAGG